MGVIKTSSQPTVKVGNNTTGGFLRRLHRKSPSQPRLSQNDFPEVWQCIVHLKLLRTFARTRDAVVDQMIAPSVLESIYANTSPSNRSNLQQTVQDRAWQIYLDQASLRFERWWKSLAPKDQSGEIRRVDKSVYERPGLLESLLRDTKPMVWTEKNIPPLDVLMIMHSFMLNPRCFLEDCIRYDMLQLWKAGMPWDVLDDILDTPTNEYLAPPAAQGAWTKLTGCPWEIGQSTLTMEYPCPVCNESMTIESSDRTLNSLHTGSLGVVQPKSVTHCKACTATFKDEELHAHRLRTFLLDLRHRNIPLPGTLLSVNGLATSAPLGSNATTVQEPFALNTLLLTSKVTDQILDLTDPFHFQQSTTLTATPTTNTTSSTSSTSHQKPTLSALEALLSTTLPTTPPPRSLRVALHRLHAVTSDTLSRTFSLSLSAATSRQTLFITAMEQIDWLHCPSLAFTITALLSRYTTFFRVMQTHPDRVAVPTHAVDLAWHTHQLDPAGYYSYSVRAAGGVFIDHDDRIEEGVRTGAFEFTAEQYGILTGGEVYGACLCWYCATALELVAGTKKGEGLGSGSGFAQGHVAVEVGSALDVMVCTRIAGAQYVKLQEEFEFARRRKAQRKMKGGGGELGGQQAVVDVEDHERFLAEYKWLYPRAVPVIN